VPVNAVARDPGHSDSVWYAGTDIGVFLTEDSGKSWRNFTAPAGLPNVQVNDLQIVPGTGYLNAATFGRGLWRIRVMGDPTALGAASARKTDHYPFPTRWVLLIVALAGICGHLMGRWVGRRRRKWCEVTQVGGRGAVR